MTDADLKLKQYVEDELEMIATKAAHTLNGVMKPEFFSCDAGNKELVIRYPILPWQVNGLGTLHGGIMGTMVDFAMSLIIRYYGECFIPPTISLTVNYIRPVPIDDGILIKTRVTSVGKRVGTAYAEAIVPSGGKVAATSTGTYSIMK